MDSQLRALNVIDFSLLTVSSTAVGLDSAVPPLSGGKVSGKIVRRMLITSETDSVRWRADGTAPTNLIGHVLAKDETLTFTGANYKQLLKDIKFIRVTNDAYLKITFLD